MWKWFEGAPPAPGQTLSALLLREPYDERVVFVEEPGVTGKVLEEHPLDVVVSFFPGQQPVPAEDPAGIGVHHEDRMPRRVEHDGVGRLRTDPVHGQEPFAQFSGMLVQHSGRTAPIAGGKEVGEMGKSLRLDIVISARPDEGGKFPGGKPPQAGHRQGAFAL